MLLAVLALLLAWLIFGLLTSGQVDPVALAGLVVSLIGLLLATIPLLRDVGPGSQPNLATRADQLASVLVDGGRDEAAARRLNDPHILALR